MSIPSNVKAIAFWGGLTSSVLGGGYEGAKTIWPYFQNPPPLASESEVAQALQAIRKGQDISNQRAALFEQRLHDVEVDANNGRRKAVVREIEQLTDQIATTQNHQLKLVWQSQIDQDKLDLDDLNAKHKKLLFGK